MTTIRYFCAFLLLVGGVGAASPSAFVTMNGVASSNKKYEDILWGKLSVSSVYPTYYACSLSLATQLQNMQFIVLGDLSACPPFYLQSLKFLNATILATEATGALALGIAPSTFRPVIFENETYSTFATYSSYMSDALGLSEGALKDYALFNAPTSAVDCLDGVVNATGDINIGLTKPEPTFCVISASYNAGALNYNGSRMAGARLYYGLPYTALNGSYFTANGDNSIVAIAMLTKYALTVSFTPNVVGGVISRIYNASFNSVRMQILGYGYNGPVIGATYCQLRFVIYNGNVPWTNYGRPLPLAPTSTYYTPANIPFGVDVPSRFDGPITVFFSCGGDSARVCACQPANTSFTFNVRSEPNTPANFTIVAVFSDSIKMSFSSVPTPFLNVTYLLRYDTNAQPSSGARLILPEPNQPVQYFTFDGATPGATYYFKLSAQNIVATSGTASATAQVPPGCEPLTRGNATTTSSCGYPSPAGQTCLISCGLHYFGPPINLTCSTQPAWTPAGAFPDCQACDPTCLTCSGTSDSQCLTCPESRYLANNFCPSCAPNCLSCTSPLGDSCIVCEDGYYFVPQFGCRQCNSNCATCNGTATSCTSCNSPLLLVDNTCVGCDGNCATCENRPDNCTSCAVGSYLHGESCAACNENCTACSDARNCTSCIPDRFLVGSDCVGCDPTCGACSGPSAQECTSCGAGLFLVGSSCTTQGPPAAVVAPPAGASSAFSNPAVIAGASAGAAVLVALVVGVVCFLRRASGGKGKGKKDKRLDGDTTKVVEIPTRVEPVTNVMNPTFEDRTIAGDSTRILDSLSQGAPSRSSAAPATRGSRGPREPSRVFHLDQAALTRIEWSDLEHLGELGTGAVGTVVHVRQRSNFTEMALKLYDPERLTAQEKVEGLAKRAQQWAGIHHTHLVPFFGMTSDPETGDVGLVSKYMPGGTLQDSMDKMPPAEKLAALCSALKGLAFLHGSDLVHGYISPTKVLLAADHAGAGAALGDLAGVGPHNAKFVSPEQLLGQPGTRASDLYSFALTALHVMGGDLGALRAGDAPRIKTSVLHKDAQKALAQCLDKDPAERGNVGALMEVLLR